MKFVTQESNCAPRSPSTPPPIFNKTKKDQNSRL